MLYKNLELTIPFTKCFSKIRKIVFDILFYLIVATLFLGCLDFFGQQGILIASSIVLMLVYVLLKRKVIINLSVILAFIFTLGYSLAAILYAKDQIPSSVLYGSLLIVLIEFFNSFEDKKKFAFWICGACITGLFVAFILISISTYWHQGAGFSGDVINHFWTNDYGNRTGISLYEIMAIGIFLTILFYKNDFRTWYTIPLLLFFIIGSSLISIKAGNRSFLIGLFILFFGIVALKMLLETKTHLWTIILIVSNVLFLSLLLIYYLVEKNVITLSEKIMSIKVINRIFSEDLTKGRPELWGEFFQKFYKYPLGGLRNDMSNLYAHNIFLDFYTFGGIIPFLVATAFFVFLFIHLLYFINLESHSDFEKGLIIAIIFGILGLGLVEPIYPANPNCLTPLFVVFLYMSYCHQHEKNEEEYMGEFKKIEKLDDSFKKIIFESKIKEKSNNSAILLIAFDKPQALRNSINNLYKVNFLGNKVDLILSIDNSGSNEVEKVAKEAEWPFGEKIIRTFTERQGLKKHIFQCFQYAEEYDVLFLLEDDIYFSESMYAYGYNAAKFYDGVEQIAGISLYGYQGNWQNWAYRFEPFNAGYDAYFMRLGQSWGEVTTRKQWLAFKEWFKKNPDFIRDDINVSSVNRWPESSWLKYYHRYCLLENKFFVYPYVSVVSNSNGVGIHNFKSCNDFQVELQGKVREYRFQKFDYSDKDTIIYDEYMNPLWLKHYIDIDENELSIDFWCTKEKAKLSKFTLTAGYYGKKYIKSYSLSLHPIELSVLNDVEGKGIYLYETKNMLKKKPKLYNLMNYSLRTSDWRRIKFYSTKLFFKTLFEKLNKKLHRK